MWKSASIGKLACVCEGCFHFVSLCPGLSIWATLFRATVRHPHFSSDHAVYVAQPREAILSAADVGATVSSKAVMLISVCVLFFSMRVKKKTLKCRLSNKLEDRNSMEERRKKTTQHTDVRVPVNLHFYLDGQCDEWRRAYTTSSNTFPHDCVLCVAPTETVRSNDAYVLRRIPKVVFIEMSKTSLMLLLL